MSLQLYNSLEGKKQEFIPLEEGKVGMYVCGVTVYDYCHVGHARVMIVFDVMYRWLKQSGYDVNYIRNFTDVDDKIIARAAERNIDIQVLTNEMIAEFHKDMDALGCLRPSLEPRATTHMPAMITMIESLIKHGNAYVSDSGDVLYAVRSFEGYGKLSGKNIDDLESGSRVDVDESKRDTLDFVLWKKAKAGEPSWDSPWGEGRPGWHIECSAMSCEHLGHTFDIHGGGMDLKFPHHENEIAQACASNDGQFARYWLHNGFVNINAEKMSKSLGNFFSIREVLKKYHPEVLRMFILGTHYRSPLDFSDSALDVAKAGLDRLYETKRRLKKIGINELIPAFITNDVFEKAMNDDFNTPEALAKVFSLNKEINKRMDAGLDVFDDDLLIKFSTMLGLLAIVKVDADGWFQGVDSDLVSAIENLIVERAVAKKSRDFARADAIRDALAVQGIVLEDSATGTTWKRG
ncbi:MAG: cysteine--tRNA ligase [Mariprofundaceae bacterium]|nr:cysteine--tRNA ligase [Mariprofundaceae bacterium]